MKLEELIGKGTNNEVYRSGDAAVKIFRKDYKKSDVLHEAFIASKIEETGLNLPSVREVPVIDGKWAIVMDLVEGKTMKQMMEEDPDNLEKYVDQMVDIQLMIHNKKCDLLPHLRDKMISRINDADLDSTKRYELLTIMDGTPKHRKLCHGDFNPQNIVISKGVPYILDWNHATQGNASADVARTYLWLCLYNEKAADLYLNAFCEKSGTEKRYVQQWLPVVAAARLTKNIPEEQDLLRKWIDVVQYE